MANKHYKFPDEEIEVVIKVKVKNIGISTYQHQSEIDLKNSLSNFKDEISKYLKEKLMDTYYQQEVTQCVDWWSFDVVESKEAMNKLPNLLEHI